MNEKNYSKVPVFENGLAQPVFPLTDGKTGEKYDPATSSIVRYCVYVETDYDVDGDGKRDLVKAVVQVPRSAVEGNYKAATLYEVILGSGRFASNRVGYRQIDAAISLSLTSSSSSIASCKASSALSKESNSLSHSFMLKD